jgi:hypothetical protein
MPHQSVFFLAHHLSTLVDDAIEIQVAEELQDAKISSSTCKFSLLGYVSMS